MDYETRIAYPEVRDNMVTSSRKQPAKSQMSQTASRHAPERLLLRVPEVADRLGLGLTKTWALVNTGEIRSITIGKSRRVPVEALEEWLRQKENTL